MRRDDWLAQQLPAAMTEDDFLMRFLMIFQSISDTMLDQVDGLGHQFDPTVAPESMVHAMVQWIGVDWADSSIDSTVKRKILREYSALIKHRGTKAGLQALLEILMNDDNGTVAVIDEPGGVFRLGDAPTEMGHVRLEMSSPGWNRLEDLIRIIAGELPVSVTFELWVADKKEWPRPGRALALVGDGTIEADTSGWAEAS